MSALFTGPGRLGADAGRPGPIADVMRDLDAEFFVDWQVEPAEPFAWPQAHPMVGTSSR